MRRKTNKLPRAVLAAGVLSMVLSVSLCVGSTFAPFTDTLNVRNKLEIGSFAATATVGLAGTESAEQLSSQGTILSAGEHQLFVHAEGTTSGCVLIFLDAAQSDTPTEVYRIRHLNNGVIYTHKTYQYKLVLKEETMVSVDSVWGETQQGTPLEDGTSLTYGVETQENKQTMSIDGEQIVSAESPSSADSTDTTVGGGEDTSTSGGGKDKPATDGGENTPSDGGGETTTPADGADTTPTTGNGESTPTTDGGEGTPPAGVGEDSSTTGAENTPGTGGGEGTPITGGTDSAQTIGDTPE